jgi:hypothetical protein
MAGVDGRYMSINSGPNAESAPQQGQPAKPPVTVRDPGHGGRREFRHGSGAPAGMTIS